MAILSSTRKKKKKKWLLQGIQKWTIEERAGRGHPDQPQRPDKSWNEQGNGRGHGNDPLNNHFDSNKQIIRS
jgi:hypothetical protein